MAEWRNDVDDGITLEEMEADLEARGLGDDEYCQRYLSAVRHFDAFLGEIRIVLDDTPPEGRLAVVSQFCSKTQNLMMVAFNDMGDPAGLQ
jgi:hypothetical protein